jgi:hypothetical protein
VKGTLIKKFSIIGLVLIFVIGTLSAVGLFSSTVNSEAVYGAQVVAADGEVSFDENEDGWIDAKGNDDIAIEWTVDYAPATTYIRIIRRPFYKVTTESFYEDGNCIRQVRWCNDVMKNVFGAHNTIQIWHGKKLQGYSEVKFDLPRRVVNFPIDFYLKSSVNVNYLTSITESVVSNNNNAYTYAYSESNGKKVVDISCETESEDINNIESNTNTFSVDNGITNYPKNIFMERILQLRPFSNYIINKFFS